MDFLLWLQQIRSAPLDAFFLFVTALAEEVALFGVLLLVYWCIDKRAGFRIGLFYFVSGMFGQTLKLVFRVERPFVLDGRLQPHESAVEAATGYSFPSGHTTSAASMMMGVGMWLKKRWLWVLLALYTALVALSRLYLGVHTPQDVLVAAALAVGLGFVAERILASIEKPGRARVYFILGLGLGLGIMALGGALVALGMVPAEQASDGFKIGGAALALVIGLWLERTYIHFCEGAKPWQQLLKLVGGIAIALALKEGLKLLLGTALPMQALRYFIVVLFVIALYPALFTWVLNKTGAAK